MRFFDPRFDATSLFAGSMFNPLRVPVLLAHGQYDDAVPFTMWMAASPKCPTRTCTGSNEGATNSSSRNPCDLLCDGRTAGESPGEGLIRAPLLTTDPVYRDYRLTERFLDRHARKSS